MAYESVRIKEIVDRAVGHNWSVPEFQRGFVWKPTQVRDLAESMWYDFPVGTLLVWNSGRPTEPQLARDAQPPTLWVVDGQQRTATFCILFGRKPYWWSSVDEWNKTLKRYDVRFDVHAKEPPFFVVANAVIRQTKGNRYIPLSKLLVLDTSKEEDQKTLQKLARDVKADDLCPGMDAMEVYTRLDRVRKIREKDIVTITIDHDLEDVVEIFSRLNSRGTRVTEADIYLGIVAAKNPGWVRDSFMPYLKTLGEGGFELNPNLLFRTLTGIGCRRVRFREVDEAFWQREQIEPAWGRTKKAWGRLIRRFREYGILSNDPMPTQAALVVMTSLIERFDDDSNFAMAMYWFVQASRFARYSGSSATSLEEDLRDVNEADALTGAVQRLLRRLPQHEQRFESEDFLRSYRDGRFGRFLLYLLVYRNGAHDWDQQGHRIGFEGAEVLAGFRPQWHHVFPKKLLQGWDNGESIDALANIAVIGQGINIRISAKKPLDYIERYNIQSDKLRQQFIDEDITSMSVDNYESWLKRRAEVLAGAANQFVADLKEVG
ncbi:MAG: DUF262 domain-containing protein [Phycisphaerae bacterium]